MCATNEANINYYVARYADRRLRKVLRGEKVWDDEDDEKKKKEKKRKKSIFSPTKADKTPFEQSQDVTIVTACDEKYVDVLRETFANWRKYKNIDEYPVIVFINGLFINDERLDFLRLPNVRLVPWAMDNVEDHREEMLTAFVIGAAENVQTEYWLKLDADSYATDDRPFIDESMKQYDFCGHKWGYSRPNHIKKLDEWAKNHGRAKLKNAKPMINEGRIEGRRFYHNTKRTISFIQLHKTKFTKFCVKLLDERRLPAPTQDTFMFFVANRFDPHHVGMKNFKKNYGFTQGKGRWGAEGMREKLKEVDEKFNASKVEHPHEMSQDHPSEPEPEIEEVIEPIKEVKAIATPRLTCMVPEGHGVVIEIRRV